MKITMYSTKAYEKKYFETLNQGQHEFIFTTDPLQLTTVAQATGSQGLCCFVTDEMDQHVLCALSKIGIQFVALRSAGYDHVDLAAAKQYQITVVRVPAYSPQSVAEFAVGLILTLNRKIHHAYLQGLQHNFSLEGLLGFNLDKKTVGIIGTGHIGTAFVKIMQGFGCHLIAYDIVQNELCLELGVTYVSLETLLAKSDIISLHCPLNDSTKYLINEHTLSLVKPGMMLINTGRGALIDTQALITALKHGQVGYAGLDVYEKEKGLFFIDHQNDVIDDPLFLELQTLPGVLITPHQAFFTQEAVTNIVNITLHNITDFEKGMPTNQLT